MRPLRLVLSSFVALVFTACATTQPMVRSEFEDIPVPKVLAYVDTQSVVIESPSVKAARLIYRGRIEVGSLAVAMRTTLEANGWRSISNTSAADQGTTQVYEKTPNTLQVRLWESWYYTYVELTATRSLSSPTAATK